MHVTDAKRGKTRACKARLVFGLASRWMKKWHGFFLPITGRDKAKPKQTRNYFRHSIVNRSIPGIEIVESKVGQRQIEGRIENEAKLSHF